LANEFMLEMRNISKSFAGVHALKNVTFCARRGKVNVLMGENGAGKSTLMKILAGAHPKDSGKIIIDGQEIEIESPQDAMNKGVAMIYQELNLVQDMTVAQNIFMGVEPTNGAFVNNKYVNAKAAELLDAYDMGISPHDVVGELSMGKQQMLEIIKAISKNAKIVIMDEPTSSLTNQEVDKLFDIIHRLNEEDITVIYISHRMEEVFSIGDYITVMRDGETVCDLVVKETCQEELIRNMVGRNIDQMFPKEEVPIGDVVLEVKGLTKKGLYNDVSFNVRKGEILGMSGLIGAGRTEVALSLFGDITPDSGDIFIDGQQVRFNHPSQAMAKKIAYVPEDRKHLGLDLNNHIRDNISVSNMDKLSRNGFVQFAAENELCNSMVEQLRIKTNNIMNVAGSLSGGNQQKVVLGKWLSRDLDVLILDEPTRGVDVGAKEEIHKIIVDLARKGLAIILISSELPEVLGMSDRIVVMHEGEVTGILDTASANQELVMSYATGIQRVVS